MGHYLIETPSQFLALTGKCRCFLKYRVYISVLYVYIIDVQRTQM